MESLVIISTANLYYGNSAAVVRMNMYARALAIANVRVYLLCANALEGEGLWIEVEHNIYSLPQKGKNRVKVNNIISVYSLIKKFKRRLRTIRGHVVVLNYPSTNSLLLDIFLLLYCRNYHIICEVNEVRKYASGSQHSLKNRLYCYFLEKTYKYYHGIIYISKHIQNFYSCVNRNSIVVPILSDCNNAYVISSGIESLDFVFVGSIYFEKENLEELLEGFSLFAFQYPKARLKLYGVLPDKDRIKLEHYFNKEGLCGRLFYCGPLQHSDVSAVLSSAGALILPRSNNLQNYYGFSTKLSEYAVSGTPIIMTNTGVVADYFEDGVNCLMCEGYDRTSFNKKFEEFAQMNLIDRKRLAENAYHLAHAHFDYRLYSDSLFSFLFGK